MSLYESSNDHAYHRHLDHCERCRNNPLDQCDEGDRSLRETVESGQGGSYDRLLYNTRNGQ